MGDPAGIGPDIVEKAWHSARDGSGPPFVYIADPRTLRHVPVVEISDLSEAEDVFREALPVYPVRLPNKPIPGQPDGANSISVITAIETAVKMCLESQAAAMVTAPVAKESLYAVGFNAPGQTEFLADACGFARKDVVMMLAGQSLKVVPVTIHLPLAQVPEALTQSLIMSRAITTHRALQKDFNIAQPRLALCGLNPHAGEKGAIGREELEVIIPAIDTLRARGIDASGPFPADTMFHAEARQGYDVALSMYHDQGLVPLKTLHFYDGVNVTLGLPIIRTSPDHGTAFDIAGTGNADAQSIIAAIEMASYIAAQRAVSNAAA